MIRPSAIRQLLLLAAAGVFHRCGFRRQRPLPTSAAAVVMAIGIFIAAPLQQMPISTPSVPRLLAVALVVLWASVATSYVGTALQGTLHKHTRPVIGRFAIGTWVAATAVLARVILLEIPEWRPLAIALAVIAFLVWLWFLGIAAAALPTLAKMSSRSLTPGVVLLSTVSTQSLALVAVDLLPSGPVLRWTALSLVGTGMVFYAIGAILIVRSHAKVDGWTISEDWDNTNCILHGAMSITGLALASYAIMPPAITLAVWCYVLVVFSTVECIEVLRLVSRITKHGWRRGVFSYRVTQWSRIFTFGMFHAFTMQLSLSGAARGADPMARSDAVVSLILSYGPYPVLFFLLLEIFLCFRERFIANRIPIMNPWLHNRFIRENSPQRD